MKALRFFIQAVLLMIAIQQSSAQIGYQVSLLNSATGEPRVGETVEVEITLTDNEENIIYEETQTETTNDFGILSLTIGNSTTFDDVDWSKLPFFISVSVDGKLVGKSQVLTVPVAEYAKRTGVLTKELLVGTWTATRVFNNASGETFKMITSYIFKEDGTGIWKFMEYHDDSVCDEGSSDFNYHIETGNHIVIAYQNDESIILHYSPKIQKIIEGSEPNSLLSKNL